MSWKLKIYKMKCFSLKWRCSKLWKWLTESLAKIRTEITSTLGRCLSLMIWCEFSVPEPLESSGVDKLLNSCWALRRQCWIFCKLTGNVRIWQRRGMRKGKESKFPRVMCGGFGAWDVLTYYTLVEEHECRKTQAEPGVVFVHAPL